VLNLNRCAGQHTAASDAIREPERLAQGPDATVAVRDEAVLLIDDLRNPRYPDSPAAGVHFCVMLYSAVGSYSKRAAGDLMHVPPVTSSV
jgi:hypothetical protein